MAESKSNSNSDGDFQAIPEPEEFDIMNDPTIQAMEPNLLLMLTHFNLGNDVIKRVAASGMKYSHLSGLIKEDLEQLGIEDEALQNELLTEFGALEGQEPNLVATARGFRKDPNLVVMNQMTVIDMLQSQLYSMNTLLAATMLKVGVSRNTQSPGVVVNSNFNPPDLVLQMLQKMTKHTAQMSALIGQLQSHQAMELRAAESSKNKKPWKSIGLTSLVIASGLIVGIVLARQWRSTH